MIELLNSQESLLETCFVSKKFVALSVPACGGRQE